MPIRAILFDHDGTLVDSEPIHLALWQRVLERWGVRLGEDEYARRYAGIPTRNNAADLVRHFGLAVDPQVLVEAKNEVTRDYLANRSFPLMPGVREAVSLFARLGLRQAVVTGAPAIGARATLRFNALAPYFATVVSGDDVRRTKPHPDCYLLALERLGLPADECLAIEDTGPGLTAASGAGVRCVAVPTPMSQAHDFSAAVAVFAGLDAAAMHVRELLGMSAPDRRN